MNIWISFIVSSVVTLLLTYFYPGVQVGGYFSAFFIAIVLGGVNCCIGPAQKLFSKYPDVLNLWMISVVINMCVVLLLARFVTGFTIDGYMVAFIFSIILSLIGAAASLEPGKKIYR